MSQREFKREGRLQGTVAPPEAHWDAEASEGFG